MNNIRYILSELRRSQPVMFVLLAAELAVCVANSLFGTFTAKYVVELALTSTTRIHLAVVCLLLIIGERATALVRSEISDHRLYVGNDKFWYYLKRKLIAKNMTTDYVNNESCDKSNILKKAESGCEYAAFNTADTVGGFFIALLSLLAYGSILSLLDPAMLLIVGVPSVISFYIERHRMAWLWKNNDNWQKNDRELMYIQQAASDFSYAKDIRIYGMEKWLESVFSETFARRLGWYEKQDDCTFRHSILRMLMLHISDLAAYLLIISMAARGSIGAGDFVLYLGSIAAFGAAVREIFDKASG
ncbi:MAG: ABC transporter ATP-binding protein, partial [Oscillospiraceae bacterium]|nr:ABC transporter ATP-binding protein [Oscillospiraceae bacterium]